MSRRKWAAQLLTLGSIVGLDLFTKSLAAQWITSSFFIGPFGLVLQHNMGTLLGAFSTIPIHLRILCLSTGGSFLILVYLSAQILLREDQARLRWGATLLMGGIAGNLAERLNGTWAVTDFIAVGNVAFNLADISAALGCGLLVYALYGRPYRESIQDLRGRLWINPSFQLRYIVILTGVGVSVATMLFILFTSYLVATIDVLVGANAPDVRQQFLIPLCWTFLCVLGGTTAVLIVLGRRLSHRVSGPLYAFERFLKEYMAGHSTELKLRKEDEFKNLETLAQQLSKYNSDR